MLKTMLHVVAVLCLIAIIPIPAVAGMISTTSIADAGIGEGITSNRGVQTINYIGNPGATFKSLYQFSIASIPANQTIDSATLQLTTAPSQDAGYFNSGRTADLRRLLVSWVEGNGSSNSTPGTTGVTWTSRDKGGSLANWATVGAAGNGADRSGTPTATVGSGNISGGVLSIDVTNDVQLWYSGSGSNFGWLLEPTVTVSNGIYYGFASKESATTAPTLIVTFSPIPEPSSLLLFGMGGFAMAMIRRYRRTYGRL